MIWTNDHVTLWYEDQILFNGVGVDRVLWNGGRERVFINARIPQYLWLKDLPKGSTIDLYYRECGNLLQPPGIRGISEDYFHVLSFNNLNLKRYWMKKLAPIQFEADLLSIYLDFECVVEWLIDLSEVERIETVEKERRNKREEMRKETESLLHRFKLKL